MPKNVFHWMLGFFILSLTIFVVIAAMNPTQGTLWFEAAKTVLQVGVVSVVGAVLSLVTFEYQRRRQQADKATDQDRADREKERDRERVQEEYRDELLKSFLSMMMTPFGTVKKARRVLRSRARICTDDQGETKLRADYYYQQLEIVDEARLTIENLRRDLITVAVVFSHLTWDMIDGGAKYHDPSKEKETPWDALIQAFRDMEEYLKGLIDEFETAESKFSGDPLCCRLASLPKLDALLRITKTEYNTLFAWGYVRIQVIVRAAIQNRKLRTTSQADVAP